MKTADEYADSAEQLLSEPDQASIERGKGIAILALATATLEAARLTIDAQASSLLSALEEPEPCPVQWGDADAPCRDAGVRGGHHCDGSRGHPDRCICSCGDEQ